MYRNHFMGAIACVWLIAVGACVRELPVVDEATLPESATAGARAREGVGGTGAVTPLGNEAAGGTTPTRAAAGSGDARPVGSAGAGGDFGTANGPARELWQVVDGPDFGLNTAPITGLRKDITVTVEGAGKFSVRAWGTRSGTDSYDTGLDFIARVTNNDAVAHCDLSGRDGATWLDGQGQPLDLQVQELAGVLGSTHDGCVEPGGTVYLVYDLQILGDPTGSRTLFDELVSMVMPMTFEAREEPFTQQSMIAVRSYELTETDVSTDLLLSIANVSDLNRVTLSSDGHYLLLDNQREPLGMFRISYPDDVELAAGEDAVIMAVSSGLPLQYAGLCTQLMFFDDGYQITED